MFVFNKIKRISSNNIKTIYMISIITLNIISLHYIEMQSQKITEPIRQYNKT